MMRAAVKGAPIVSTGVLLQTSPMSAMGFVEKNIKKPEDIKGKTVAITPADSMTQIWPLFLKKTGLKEADFKTVAGDGQTKLNAVINGQADLLLGYAHGPVDEDQGRHRQGCLPDQVRRLRHQHDLFWPGRQHRLRQGQRRSGEAFSTSASTKAVEAAEKDPKGAAQAILDANPKGGKLETLTQGFELTIPLYHTAETKGKAAVPGHRCQHDRQRQPDGRVWRPRSQGQGQSEGVLYQRLPAEVGRCSTSLRAQRAIHAVTSWIASSLSAFALRATAAAPRNDDFSTPSSNGPC